MTFTDAVRLHIADDHSEGFQDGGLVSFIVRESNCRQAGDPSKTFKNLPGDFLSAAKNTSQEQKKHSPRGCQTPLTKCLPYTFILHGNIRGRSSTHEAHRPVLAQLISFPSLSRPFSPRSHHARKLESLEPCDAPDRSL